VCKLLPSTSAEDFPTAHILEGGQVDCLPRWGHTPREDTVTDRF
jgi:hypothetical protein